MLGEVHVPVAPPVVICARHIDAHRHRLKPINVETVRMFAQYGLDDSEHGLSLRPAMFVLDS